MANPNPFMPKKAWPRNAIDYKVLAGGSSTKVAHHVIAEILPPFDSGAVIHDNACGTGEVISQIMASSPPLGIHVHCTDKFPVMADECKKLVQGANWPAEVAIMPAENLTFEDNVFSHSFTNFVLPQTRANAPQVGKELFRTLKLGGTAVACTWAFLPFWKPLIAASELINGVGYRAPARSADNWFQADELKKFFEVAGFKSGNIQMYSVKAPLEAKNLRYWVEGSWSYFATPEEGWRQVDEDRWDEIIDFAVREIQKSPDFEQMDDGSFRLWNTANVGVARK